MAPDRITVHVSRIENRLRPFPGLLTRAADDGVPQSLRRLWASDGVRSVVEGDGVSARLTEDAVRALVGLAPRRDAERAPCEGNGAATVPSVS